MRWILVAILAMFVAPVLMAAPLIGMMADPWSAFRFGERAVTAIDVGGVATAPTAAVPVPTIAPAIQTGSVAVLIANALTWLGTPYAWGGCSRAGVDCSCFVMLNLATVGISAPRVTTDQIRWARPVNAAEARAGDLVFFDNTCTGCGANPTHVGLYLGGGKMVNAGDPVQIASVGSGFYAAHNPRFGRVPGL